MYMYCSIGHSNTNYDLSRFQWTKLPSVSSDIYHGVEWMLLALPQNIRMMR